MHFAPRTLHVQGASCTGVCTGCTRSSPCYYFVFLMLFFWSSFLFLLNEITPCSTPRQGIRPRVASTGLKTFPRCSRGEGVCGGDKGLPFASRHTFLSCLWAHRHFKNKRKPIRRLRAYILTSLTSRALVPRTSRDNYAPPLVGSLYRGPVSGPFKRHPTQGTAWQVD